MFLPSLYKRSKFLFLGVMLFIAGQLYFTAIGVESMPFFQWGMYSVAEGPRKSYHTLEFVVDGSVLEYTKLADKHHEMVYRPAWQYKKYRLMGRDAVLDVVHDRFGQDVPSWMIDQLTNSATDVEAFKPWLKDYLSRTLDKPVRELQIYLVKYRFNNGRWTEHKRVPL